MPTIEQRVAKIRALDPTAPKAIEELRAALRSPTSSLVFAAVNVVGEHLVSALVDELPAAFERLCEDGAKRDPSCRAKVAIVHAMRALDHWDDRVFVTGLRHVQREGWGGADDAAAELRGLCGLAHVRYMRHDALDVCAELLADPEPATRVAGAQALAQMGRPDTSALLRLRILVGDDPDVLASCFEALLELARDASVPFIIRFLREHDDRAEVAVLALGGARIAEAFDAIREWCSGCPQGLRHRTGYLALALLRAEPANEYLLDAISSHGPADAVAAARALATFKEDLDLIARIRAAALEQKNAGGRGEILELLPKR